MTTGEKLAALRKRKGITQEQLSGMRLFFPGYFRGRQAKAKAHGNNLF